MFPGLSFFFGQEFITASGMLLASSVLVPCLFRKKSVAAEAKTVIVPSAVMPIPPSSSQKMDSLMAVVRQLEAYLDRISAGGVRDEERKWQNKLRTELDGIKRAANAGDVAAAKRRLSSAELYVKMLELHMASR
jgi:hypothetical protein